MLANRILLMGLDDMPGQGANPGASSLAVANNIVPLFWLLGFSEDNLALLPLDEETPEGYPILVDRIDHVAERFSGRLDRFSELIGLEWHSLFDQWKCFLDETGEPVLAVETFEYWQQFDDSGALLNQLQGQLRAIDHLMRQPIADAESLLTLLGPCEMIDEHHRIHPTEIQLAGYGWSQS